MTTTPWHPESWTAHLADQMPRYDDEAALAGELAELGRLPPLVTSWDVEALRRQIVAAQTGAGFILQGGDCVETFADCTSDAIVGKLKVLLQMSVVMIAGLRCPVTRIGRLAGQYAKPRSSDLETRDGCTHPSYRGELYNRHAFTDADRRIDPSLMLRGYERSALTLNFVRALADGGFADLHHPENWDLAWVERASLADDYRHIVQRVVDGLDFFESVSGRTIDQAARVDVFTSHEGLHLLYEQAQTRFLPHRKRWYDLTTHFPWIGMRTADPGGAHVEFFRGVANPIAVKVGPGMTPEQLAALITLLNPDNEAGRLTLIHRFGAAGITVDLPPLVAMVRKIGARVLWVCDPMHGNTESTASGLKTRRFEHILAELAAAFRIHAEAGSRLGGVHLELTGDHVTECTGGASCLTDEELPQAYRSQVDPRLNYEQAMEIALQIARMGTPPANG